MHGHRINVEVVDVDVWVVLRDTLADVEEQATGQGQHIRLVYDRNMLCGPATGKIERRPRDSFGGLSGDDAVCDRHVRGGHEFAGPGEGVPVGVETLGVLPDEPLRPIAKSSLTTLPPVSASWARWPGEPQPSAWQSGQAFSR